MSGSQLGFSFLPDTKETQYKLDTYEACPKCLDKNDEHYSLTRSAIDRKGNCYIHDKKKPTPPPPPPRRKRDTSNIVGTL